MNSRHRNQTPTLWLGAFTFGMLFLAICSQPAEAQSNTFPSSGNAGIGVTTSLGVRLTVGRDLEIDSFNDGTTRWGLIQGYDRSVATSRPLWFEGTKYYFAAGNVGIGTTNPAQMFHVHSLGTWAGMEASTAASGATINDGANFGYDNTVGAFIWNREASPIVFGTNNAEKVRIDTNGNVGIGTTTPAYGLEVNKTNASGGGGWSALFRESGKNGVLIGSRGSGNAVGTISGALSDLSSTSDLSLNPFTGNVGIGTLTPGASYRLDVNGNTNITGNINVTGNINAKYQDVAEWVESSQALPAGTVVVLDATKSNQVVSSTVSYDTRVAGVISEQPGITLGESGDTKVLVATTGRVKVKVDASRTPIHIGDLLVTSDVSGMAMKSEPIKVGGRLMHMPGTLIGKALEPLEKGTGEILVLLSLQ